MLKLGVAHASSTSPMRAGEAVRTGPARDRDRSAGQPDLPGRARSWRQDATHPLLCRWSPRSSVWPTVGQLNVPPVPPRQRSVMAPHEDTKAEVRTAGAPRESVGGHRVRPLRRTRSRTRRDPDAERLRGGPPPLCGCPASAAAHKVVATCRDTSFEAVLQRAGAAKSTQIAN